jgi:hypothetical protein
MTRYGDLMAKVIDSEVGVGGHNYETEKARMQARLRGKYAIQNNITVFLSL